MKRTLDSNDGVLIIKGGTGPGSAVVPSTPDPAFYLAVHAIQSADNLGSLLRTAGAFGCREILVVNAERSAKRLKKTLRTFGAHGAERRVPMRAFESLDDLVAFGKRRGCDIVGVEIDDAAASCYAAFQDPRPTVFLPGNEGQGLSAKQIALCDRLVYVPHYGSATASLNVNAATAIVLSAFGAAAGYAETERRGPKFHVVDRPFLSGVEE